VRENLWLTERSGELVKLMIIGIDGRFLLHGWLHPHSQLVDVLLRENARSPYPAKIVLYTNRPPEVHWAAKYEADNVVIRVLGKKGGRWRRLWWLWRTLPQALRADGVEVFYSSFYFLPPRVHGIRLVNSIHDCCVFYIPPALNRGLLASPIYLRILKLAMRWTNRRSDRTVTVSNFSKRMLALHLNRSESRTAVCYHGVDNAAFRADLARPGELKDCGEYSLFVGSNLPKKNITGLVQAYAQLPAEVRKKHLLVLKTSPYPEDHELIARLGLQSQVVFIDRRLDEAEMRGLFKHAQVLLLMSYDEGFGLPIIEAFAAGVSVLVSKRAACGELVPVDDYSAEPSDISEIARKWERLVCEEEHRRRSLEWVASRLPEFEQSVAARRFFETLSSW